MNGCCSHLAEFPVWLLSPEFPGCCHLAEFLVGTVSCSTIPTPFGPKLPPHSLPLPAFFWFPVPEMVNNRPINGYVQLPSLCPFKSGLEIQTCFLKFCLKNGCLLLTPSPSPPPLPSLPSWRGRAGSRSSTWSRCPPSPLRHQLRVGPSLFLRGG